MAKRTILAGAAAVVGLVAALGVLGASKPKGPPIEDMNMAVTYLFEPKRPVPGHETAMIVFRNEKKLRPLYITGRGESGRMSIKFNTVPGGARSLLEDDRMRGLIDFAEARGGFTVRMGRYSHGQCDYARTVCTEWLERPERPECRLTVTDLKDFRSFRDKHDRKVRDKYDARLVGTLEAGASTIPLDVPATVQLIDAEATEKGTRLASMVVRASLVIRGADLGLTGDDAGDLGVELRCEGWTNYAQEAESLFEEMELPGLD